MSRFTRGFTGRPRPTTGLLPPGQYDAGRDWPILTAEATPHLPTDRWTFTVDGLVESPTTWSWESIHALPPSTYTGPIHLGPFTIIPTAVEHPVDAYGLRIEAHGKVIAYSGDTAETEALLDIATDADLFVCEAAFRDGVDNPPGVHITGVHAGEYATKAHVKKLVVTHVPPWHDSADALREARSAYDGPTELAATGAVYEV